MKNNPVNGSPRLKYHMFTVLLIMMLISPLLSVFVSASPSKITYAGQTFSGELDNKYVQLSNGRAVYVFIDSATPTYLRIKVVNTDGTIYGYIDKSMTPNYLSDCTVYYQSDTVVYIGLIYSYTGGSSVQKMKFGVLKLNPSALTTNTMVSGAEIDLGSSIASIQYAYLTTIIPYNTALYFMAAYRVNISGNRIGYVYCVGYTIDTALSATLVDETSSTTSSYAYPIYWFYYGSGIAYAVWEVSDVALSYYTITLATRSAVILVAHNTPSDAVSYTTAQYSHFLGGGLVPNGTDLYLYFSWIRSHQITGVNYITFIQERLIFNTTVNTAHFTGYSRPAQGITLDYSGYSSPVWCLGYSASKSQFKLFYPNILAGVTYMNRLIINIADWFDTASLTYTHVVGTSESLPDSISAIYPVSQSFTTQWGLAVDNTGVVLMYRLASLNNVYTVVGAISPADSPYIQNKQYYLAVSGKVGGLGRGGLAVAIAVNGGIPITYGLSSSGALSMPIKFTSTGISTITINLMDIRVDTSVVATQTITGVTQIADTTPTGGLTYTIQDTWLNTIINFAPSAVVIFAPATLVGVVAGPIGFIMGALVGVVLGVQASIFPTYVLYMVFLILGLLTWMIIRGGGSSQ